MKGDILSRQKVAKKANYSDHKQALREDFLFSCAYCTTAEKELCAKRFEIDHYMPQKHFPGLKNDYINLLWSCEDCNNNKSDYFPGKFTNTTNKEIFRPDKHKIMEHFELDDHDEYKIKGKTLDIGYHTIIVLRLNSQRLKTLRLRRKEQGEIKESIAYGIRHLISMLRKANTSQKKLQIHRLLFDLKTLKTTYEQTMIEIAKKKCASYLQDDDDLKKIQLKEKKQYLQSL